MNITILCSSSLHPINSWLLEWIDTRQADHEIVLCRNAQSLPGGDILFLVSCSEVISQRQRAMYDHVLVLHASALPEGKGWSPHIWSIIEGESEITVSLLEAEDEVDSGDIWSQERFEVPRHALYDEINRLLFEAEISLMDFAVANHATVKPQKQDKAKSGSYFPKRTPEDSEVDVTLSIAEQFDLIRVCDPERYPAFFELHGHRYALKLEKIR